MKLRALLLPQHLKERPSPAFRAVRVALIVLPFVAFAWITVRFVNTSRLESSLEAQLVPLRQERAKSIKAIQALIVPPADVARVEASVAALNATTHAGARGVLAALPGLERALPDGAFLDSLTAKPEKGAVRVSLKGFSADHAGLARTADRLGQAGVTLRSWIARPTGGLEWTAEGDLK